MSKSSENPILAPKKPAPKKLLPSQRAQIRKNYVQRVTGDYLKSEPVSEATKGHCNLARGAAKTELDKGDFSKTLEQLEIARDARLGIRTTIRSDGVVVRDARAAIGEKELGPEGFEMQYLNAIRAAIDIADKDPGVAEEKRKVLKDSLLKQAKDFMGEKHDSLDKKSHVKNINALAEQMRKSGVEDPYKKLHAAKDFQNLKDTHRDIVTITQLKKGGHTINMVEAEIGFKSLTDKQKEEYKQVQAYEGKLPIKQIGFIGKLRGKKQENHGLPKWFVKLKPYEQQLCKDNVAAILDGKHIIPTQLRKLPGLRNAFEKITSVQVGKGPLAIVHEANHSGSVACLSSDKAESIRTTEENVKQAQSWVGEEQSLHMNVLNSSIGKQEEMTILSRAVNAAKALKVRCTVTPLDGRRHISRTETGELKKTIKTAPGPVTEETHESIKGLNDALSTKKRGERDFKISSALGRAGHTAKKIFGKILTMCASGKDRTGAAMHDQSVQSIKTHLKQKHGIAVTEKEIDEPIIRGGGTAQQAGSPLAGGASIGNHGIKEVGVPEERKAELDEMREITASTNKIKEPRFNSISRMKNSIQQKSRSIVNALKRKSSIVTIYSKESSPGQTPGTAVTPSGKREL